MGLYNTFDNPESIEKLNEIDIWKRIYNPSGQYFGQNIVLVNLGLLMYQWFN